MPDEMTTLNFLEANKCSILPLWWSAQWKLVEMRVGTTQVFRIQNRWKPDQYLHVENGVIQSGTILAGWHSSLWILTNI